VLKQQLLRFINNAYNNPIDKVPDSESDADNASATSAQNKHTKQKQGVKEISIK
jgi:hypothetical protein